MVPGGGTGGAAPPNASAMNKSAVARPHGTTGSSSGAQSTAAGTKAPS